MRQLLDMESWARKEHFQFFRQFEEPFFGVCADVDCTAAYQRAQGGNGSFFLQYLHATLTAANQIEPFRYRIDGEQVWVYDQVHASPTIDRPGGTFGFAYIDYHEDFHQFTKQAQAEIHRVKGSTGLHPAVSGENVLHCSALPWINFTGLSHARKFSFADSCPKISFGKIKDQHGRKLMPVSVHVHHALMDGYHAGLFFQALEELMGKS
ncbi:chloramphenicol acetyltransferase [Chitinophaga horti]|uniref:Chloramphenicol acetyltransferase n=1 Tax=Chitinophaga horti TaxID=2920382 RepID=A0ABY6J7T8_9BACT|nr:chloramphenicol acetyltransferase [Chitinophaga horti]UYQ94346.1 chloramphenicol acetyltransferase [Chitinophaga horti]